MQWMSRQAWEKNKKSKFSSASVCDSPYHFFFVTLSASAISAEATATDQNDK